MLPSSSSVAVTAERRSSRAKCTRRCHSKLAQSSSMPSSRQVGSREVIVSGNQVVRTGRFGVQLTIDPGPGVGHALVRLSHVAGGQGVAGDPRHRHGLAQQLNLLADLAGAAEGEEIRDCG